MEKMKQAYNFIKLCAKYGAYLIVIVDALDFMATGFGKVLGIEESEVKND